MNNKYIIILLFVIAILSCIGLALLLERELRENRAMTIAKKFMEKTEKNSEARRKKEHKLQQEEGNRENKNIFLRLDLLLERSGLTRIIKFLNSETFIGYMLCASVAIAWYVLKNYDYIFCTIALLCFWFVTYAIIYGFSIHTEKIINENLLQFSNLLESYSASSSDIIEIFELSSEYLDEPLRGAIKNCVIDARSGMSIRAAIEKVKIKMGNRKLSELLVNIEECSKSNADYAKIVRQMHISIDVYMTEKEERKKMVNQARAQIAIMVGVFIFSIKLIESMFEQQLFSLLMSTSMGKGIVLGVAITFFFVLYKMITMERI